MRNCCADFHRLHSNYTEPDFFQIFQPEIRPESAQTENWQQTAKARSPDKRRANKK